MIDHHAAGGGRLARIVCSGALALTVLACGDDDSVATDAPAATGDGDPEASVPRSTPTTARVEPGTLPFDFGPGIVAGGDDVVPADGLEVPTGRFVLQLGAPLDPTPTEAYRLVPDADREQRVRQVAAALLGDPVDEADFHVDGGQFEFHAEGHGHDDGPPPTTVPSGGEQPPLEVGHAVTTLLEFVDDAGLGPVAGEPTTFESGGFLSVEVGLQLVPGIPVTRAEVSITFDASGAPIGGFGPIGRPERWGSFDLVPVEHAVRRLELTHALAGYPTTTSTVAGPPVELVSGEVVLTRREVVAADGLPTGDTWLVPSWRFRDSEGNPREVLAVTADALQLP